MSNLLISLEKLYHFQCGICKGWWTIADAHEPLLKEWFCPWCGTKQTVGIWKEVNEIKQPIETCKCGKPMHGPGSHEDDPRSAFSDLIQEIITHDVNGSHQDVIEADDPLKFPFSLGALITATKVITEGGDEPGNDNAKYPARDYIHAYPGDLGIIIHIRKSDMMPTVRFLRTGTATIVMNFEIKLYEEEDNLE